MGKRKSWTDNFLENFGAVVGQKLHGNHIDLPFGIKRNSILYQPHFRSFGDLPFFRFINFILRQKFVVGFNSFYLHKRENIAFFGNNVHFGDFGSARRAQKKISVQNLIPFIFQIIRRDLFPQCSRYFCVRHIGYPIFFSTGGGGEKKPRNKPPS